MYFIIISIVIIIIFFLLHSNGNYNKRKNKIIIKNYKMHKKLKKEKSDFFEREWFGETKGGGLFLVLIRTLNCGRALGDISLRTSEKRRYMTPSFNIWTPFMDDHWRIFGLNSNNVQFLLKFFYWRYQKLVTLVWSFF